MTRLAASARCNEAVDPLDFFSHLVWINGRPLLDTIEPYRRTILRDVLFSFEPDGSPRYNLALCGRAKKNWKTADLALAALYRFLAWSSPQGNDCYILANDEDQAGDDLALMKKLIAANPQVAALVEVRQAARERRSDQSAQRDRTTRRRGKSRRASPYRKPM